MEYHLAVVVIGKDIGVGVLGMVGLWVKRGDNVLVITVENDSISLTQSLTVLDDQISGGSLTNTETGTASGD